MKVERIHIGGWFQRTTLHLSEIHDFFQHGTSPLPLDAAKLRALHQELGVVSLELEVENMEYLRALTATGTELRVFEDGLILLSADARGSTKEELQEAISSLTAYYEKRLSPALSCLFSLGAPVPKELANIKTIYPYFVVLKDADSDSVRALLKEFDQEEYFEVERSTFDIFRGNELYVVSSKGERAADIRRFIEEQIFIREFKVQLHHYLNLHRTIWEKIAAVKEKGEIRGKDVSEFTTKIEGYAKTINLIEARINQMGSYIETRERIAANDPHLKKFMPVLQYKHEKLLDTLAYVKEIWQMTKNYVESARQLFSDIQAKSTEASVKNLTIVTSVGVGATLIGLLAQKQPTFTLFGVFYFIILVFIGWSANKIIQVVAQRRMYEIKDTELSKDLGK